MKKLLLTSFFLMLVLNVDAKEKNKTEQCQMKIDMQELGSIAQNFIHAFANNDPIKAQAERAAAQKKITEANIKHEYCLNKTEHVGSK